MSSHRAGERFSCEPARTRRDYIRKVLAATANNKTQAAKILGTHPHVPAAPLKNRTADRRSSDHKRNTLVSLESAICADPQPASCTDSSATDELSMCI